VSGASHINSSYTVNKACATLSTQFSSLKVLLVSDGLCACVTSKNTSDFTHSDDIFYIASLKRHAIAV
jgi:hypothetical protein